jgi:hypothetical protein
VIRISTRLGECRHEGEILYVPGPTPAMMAQALEEDMDLTIRVDNLCFSIQSLGDGACHVLFKCLLSWLTELN